ncbi:hypothetical protein BN1013_02107 [Candidatus Rubidus massiliensis]|nr:hypothetical protein BN1013_02107 [Candidatus Rubidus massiliensis]
MTITNIEIRCSLQIALLGAVTPNLRAVIANHKDYNVELYFYYETSPSDDEVDLSDIVETEVYSYFKKVFVKTYRIVSPVTEKIPSFGLWVYRRSE